MSCKRCQSSNQNTFEAETSIHFREVKMLKKAPVLSFAPLIVCLDCGFIESRLADSELQELIDAFANPNNPAE
jgi:hypothetical protein